MVTSSPLPSFFQPPKGYRYNIDSVLLAKFARFKKEDRVCDLGAGVGVIGLLALFWGNVAHVTAIEVQEELASFAEQNLKKMNCEERMEVLSLNWKECPKKIKRKSFDVVISNPPYRKIKTGREPPDFQRAIAKYEVLGEMKNLIETSHSLLKPSGRFYVIYPCLRLEELILEIHQSKFKVQRMRFIHPYANRAANLVMIEAVLSTPREIKVEPPLIVYQDSDHYTAEVEAWVGKKKKEA